MNTLDIIYYIKLSSIIFVLGLGLLINIVDIKEQYLNVED